MGGNCQTPVDAHSSLSAATLQQLTTTSHPLLGTIIPLPNSQIATLVSSSPSLPSLPHLQERIHFLQNSRTAVTTLLPVLGQARQLLKVFREKAESKATVVVLEWREEESLDRTIEKRERRLRRVGESILSELKQLRLGDYCWIDGLPSKQRQVVNNYFQEIEVVRMLDHLIGALYFLHHYQIPHHAIRPSTILLDSQGKALTLEPQLFGIPPNDLQSPLQSGHKTDIFSLAQVALKMCLLGLPQTEDTEKQLRAVRERYSDDLHDLLRQMLQVDVQKRVDYPQLIDFLNPLLLSNFKRMQQLHAPVHHHSHSPLSDPCSNLRQPLFLMEQKFQRVMNKRTLTLQEPNHQTLREQEHLILTKLKELSSTGGL